MCELGEKIEQKINDKTFFMVVDENGEHDCLIFRTIEEAKRRAAELKDWYDSEADGDFKFYVEYVFLAE